VSKSLRLWASASEAPGVLQMVVPPVAYVRYCMEPCLPIASVMFAPGSGSRSACSAEGPCTALLPPALIA
jgi:hypothetical protein